MQASNFPAVTLFGEAEKGELCIGRFCSTLWQLWDSFGEPPENTEGLFYAIQSLNFGKPVLYFRVEEEGSSLEDYEIALSGLESSIPEQTKIGAIFLPKMGARKVISHCLHICVRHAGLLIMTNKDLFDYLTDTAPSRVIE